MFIKEDGITNDDYTVCTSSYYNTDITTQSISLSGVTGYTTALMKQQSTYVGWDFENVWYMDEESGYPKLRIFLKE